MQLEATRDRATKAELAKHFAQLTLLKLILTFKEQL